jgi:TadE-like protein
VTAETAVALPALILVTVAAIWGVTVATAQLGCVDAARAGARAAARGEPLAAVRAAVRAAAPPGARVDVRRGDRTTRVDVAVAVRAPVPIGLPSLTPRAHALAANEPGVTAGPTG